MNLFIPKSAATSPALKDVCDSNKNIQVHYFNYTVFKGFENIAFKFYRKNLATPQSQNVLVASLFLAINCGFKKVYLTGADHTWHQNLHVDEEMFSASRMFIFMKRKQKSATGNFIRMNIKRKHLKCMRSLPRLVKPFMVTK